jgi:hypothetical protein
MVRKSRPDASAADRHADREGMQHVPALGQRLVDHRAEVAGSAGASIAPATVGVG